MANTYTQVHLHLIFAVQNRRSLINEGWKTRLYEYITGIVQENTHKMLIINGMPDHLHLAIGMRPIQSISDLMQDIKGSSSAWINKNKLIKGKFEWQEGYGAFSYNKSLLPKLIDYIKNQEEHHKKKSFIQEYKEFLDLFEVEYDERYIFKELED
jgi:putative transposase